MGNLFKAHIFKRRSVGAREEVTIKLFDTDDAPIDLGTAVLAAWKGIYDTDQDYPVGSIVRHEGATYLAVEDAASDDLEPGEVVEMTRYAYYQNGDRNSYVLPKNMEVLLADLDTSGNGYNFAGLSRWFRIIGTPGEQLTFVTTGVGGNTMAVYDHEGGVSGAHASPWNVVVPPDGAFNMEVSAAVTTFKYYGPEGPQPIAVSPWVLFA